MNRVFYMLILPDVLTACAINKCNGLEVVSEATGTDRFLIIYSDCKHLNDQKEFRNAIKVRKVIVNPN